MILNLKELLNKDITVELYAYYKEQLIKLYDQLSPNNELKEMKDNVFIDFVNRSNVFVFVNEKIEIHGAITALYERKIIHNGGIVCHVEDFIIDQNHRNKNIGTQLLNHVIDDAKKHNVYKIILDCKSDLSSYYSKFGFSSNNVQMSMYFD
jgi:GNAT superfamily N-acetyltransferase